MKRLHLIFGLVLFIAFLLTGQYMDKFLNHLEGVEIGVRMLYRTRHIFVLLASLVHVALGLYHQPRTGGWQRYAQTAGSVVLTIGSGVLVYAFFSEAPARDLSTPHSHRALYLMLFGLILHLASGWREPHVKLSKSAA